MCGITGCVRNGGAPSRPAVEEMAMRLRHRGPDAIGSQALPNCALAHTRLRIIDLRPSADQPMSNEDGSVWVVFNGELYNFAELRRELKAGGHRFRSDSDTEVLVHLYEEHGEQMAERLRGMFAFALWDERARRLLLCRDRLGIKPLYYRRQGGELAFASEVRALARPTDTLDAGAVLAYLRLGWVPGPATILAGVKELPPAHMLVWEAGEERMRAYWCGPFPQPERRPPESGEFAEVLCDAMRQHVVADVAVGLFLSSGVDSAVVARLARRVAPDMPAYTVVFDTGQDEGLEAAELARRLGIGHTLVRVGGEDVLGSLGRMIADMDQPTVDGLNSWVISRAVRESGLVVALSGLGGDELFGGYSTFRHVPRFVRAGRTFQRLPGWARFAPVQAAGRLPLTAHWRGRRALEAVAAGGWEDAYASVRGLFGAWELAELWTPEPGIVLGGDRDGGLVKIPWTGELDARTMVSQLELANYLPYQLLRDTDCMSMAHGLEVRVPLLDDRVVELAMASQRAHGGRWGKDRLVATVDSELGYLVERPKKTFTLPFDRWMKGPLRDRVTEALAHLGEASLGFDHGRLRRLWSGYADGRVGWRAVWALAVLGMWLEGHRGSAMLAPTRSLV